MPLEPPRGAPNCPNLSSWTCSTFWRGLIGEAGAHGSDATFRLVSMGWKTAHDQQCTRMTIRLYHKMPKTLPSLPQVTEVDQPSDDYGRSRCNYPRDGVLAAYLPKLQSLPSLTSLKIQLPEALSKADASALGKLTTLRSLDLLGRGVSRELQCLR